MIEFPNQQQTNQIDDSQPQNSGFNLNKDDMLLLGMSLLGASNGGMNSPDAITGVLSSIMQSKNQKAGRDMQAYQLDLSRKRFEFEKQQEARMREQYAKNLALQQAQEQRLNDIQQRAIRAGGNISQVIGSEPSMENNFQGSGLLGNMMNIDPITRARIYTSQSLAQSGDVEAALRLLPENAKPSFGNPVSGIDETGKPTYFMTDNSGNIKRVQGYMPEPKKGTQLIVNPDGTVSFSQGGSAVNGNAAPTNATMNDLQKDIVNYSDQLNRLDGVKKDYSKAFLTYAGRGRGLASATLEKITGQQPDKEFLQQKTQFKNGVEQLFNQYRKEITGAAASVQELERLKESLLNTDQSPSEFQAAYGQFRGLIEKSLSIKQKLLAQGIPVGSEQFGKMIDSELFGTSSKDKKNSSNKNTIRRYNPNTRGLE